MNPPWTSVKEASPGSKGVIWRPHASALALHAMFIVAPESGKILIKSPVSDLNPLILGVGRLWTRAPFWREATATTAFTPPVGAGVGGTAGAGEGAGRARAVPVEGAGDAGGALPACDQNFFAQSAPLYPEFPGAFRGHLVLDTK